MCTIAQEGERAILAQQGSQLIGCHFLVTTLVDKHANILVKSLPYCQELVHISVHVFLYRVALSSKATSC